MGITVLVDTHVLIWALLEPQKLSQRIRHLLEDAANTLWVSSASAWEITTKHRLGRLPQALALVYGYSQHLRTLQATELPIRSEHALLAGSLEWEHRDPFDRILVAQARIEGVPLVTSDAVLRGFEVQTLW